MKKIYFFWKNALVSVATFRWLLNVDDPDDANDDAVADPMKQQIIENEENLFFWKKCLGVSSDL